MRTNPKRERRNQGANSAAHASCVMRHLTLPVFAALLAPLLLSAANYSIDWHTIDGGGGTSTNAQYSITGTLGQPDAGRMSGGNFTLQGGFWAVVAAVQTPGAPWLSVTNLGGLVLVSWPAPAEGWLLERTNNITGAPGPWTPLPPPYQTNAGVISVSFPNTPPVENQFFRLRKP